MPKYSTVQLEGCFAITGMYKCTFYLYSYIETPATTTQSNNRQSVELQQWTSFTGAYSVIQRQPGQHRELNGQYLEQRTDPSGVVLQETELETDPIELVQQETKLETDLSGLDKQKPEEATGSSGVVKQENTELNREQQESTFSAEPSTPPSPVPSHSPIKTPVKVRVGYV